ncbi:MAG: TIGR03905 family TSCPD domain-containing protein [Clostridia bacterium]|nr:TIGR03905 family TSCPD domain-containing protein [Clostridia bacterium]
MELDGDTVVSAKFEGGCNGNTKGISSLVVGMNIDEVINRLEGINCGFKGTSCPDQLAQALKMAKEQKN